MKDTFGRPINYLRLSVTDLCDLRCRYCMPEAGVPKRPHSDILSLEEMGTIVEALASLGITKVRITGGDPLVRRGVVELCRDLAQIPGIHELCMTTNGTRLASMAPALKEAGVQRLNISLDTLDGEKYKWITRGGELSKVLQGIHKAQSLGFAPLKVNVVLMGGWNEDEIPAFVRFATEEDLQVRFIELMPLGECATWDSRWFVPATQVLQQCPELLPLPSPEGVAQVYQSPGGRGSIGLIRPMSQHFCGRCNRLRLTADGKLKPCLHSSTEIPLRGLEGDALRERLREAILQKPAQHGMEQGKASQSARPMHRIGG